MLCVSKSYSSDDNKYKEKNEKKKKIEKIVCKHEIIKLLWLKCEKSRFSVIMSNDVQNYFPKNKFE